MQQTTDYLETKKSCNNLEPVCFIGKNHYPRNQGIFQYVFFNANMQELGHYIPDLNAGTIFDTPRLWSKKALESVIIEKE